LLMPCPDIVRLRPNRNATKKDPLRRIFFVV
jgi:hypothetical protein